MFQQREALLIGVSHLARSCLLRAGGKEKNNRYETRDLHPKFRRIQVIVDSMKLLIIEDDRDIARQLSGFLEDQGFVVQLAFDGEEGHYLGAEEEYDAVLLDIGLPLLDGLSVLERWRAAGRTMPVIVLTARTSKMETIRGLEAGADDYIHKPFDLEEVLARVRTNIRRDKGQHEQVLTYQNVSFDGKSGKVFVDGSYVKLTRIEFLIVQYLFLNRGRFVSVTELSEHVYRDFDHDSSIIARHIANIRKKLGAEIILTESNRGYYVPQDE